MTMLISHFPAFILSIFLFSNIFITQSNSNEFNKPLIDTTCQKISTTTTTVTLQFCTSSLEYATLDPCIADRCLGFGSINLLHQNVTGASSEIKVMMENKALDPNAMACLTECSTVYTSAVASVDQIKLAYREKRYPDATVDVTSMINGAKKCEDGFKAKGATSPLTKSNTDVVGVGSLVLGIMGLIE